MATKDEYYQRIIASLQADISSQNKAISDLKSTVARQQEEIEALKASHGDSQKSMEPQQKRITTENLLLAVKRVCDDVIRTNNEQLPTMFTDRQEFENFRKSAEQKFISADTITDYKKSLENRLSSIEGKLTHRYSLLTINRHDKNSISESKSYFNLDMIITPLKTLNPQWLYPILICMLAFYLLSSITD